MQEIVNSLKIWSEAEIKRTDDFLKRMQRFYKALDKDDLSMTDKIERAKELAEQLTLVSPRSHEILRNMTVDLIKLYYKIGDTNFLPMKKRFYNTSLRRIDILKGMWVTYSYRYTIGSVHYANIMEKLKDRIDKDVYIYVPPGNRDGDVMYVRFLALIVDVDIQGEGVWTIARFIGENGKVIRTLQMYANECSTSQKVYIYRNTFAKLVRLVRLWLNHKRYQPGAIGFHQSKQSFETLASKQVDSIEGQITGTRTN